MKEFSRDEKIDSVFKKMSAEEQRECLRYKLCGMIYNEPDGSTTILMGSESLDRYDNFIDKMYKKYS